MVRAGDGVVHHLVALVRIPEPSATADLAASRYQSIDHRHFVDAAEWVLLISRVPALEASARYRGWTGFLGCCGNPHRGGLVARTSRG